MDIIFRHAGAGSGKTYSIEQDIASRLVDGRLQPDQLVAVTFTNRAADELLERIGGGLLARGRPDLAALLDQARIGTVNSVCGRLLQEFCFDLGLSPAQRVIDERDKQLLLNEALDGSLATAETAALNEVAARLGEGDWQSTVLDLVERARMNDFAGAQLGRFADDSVAGLLPVLPAEDPSIDEAELRDRLATALATARRVIKPTKGLQESMEKMERWLRRRSLAWEDWVRVSKLKAGTKEAHLLESAIEYGAQVLKCPGFRRDLETLIRGLFDAGGRVMDAFARLKVERGLVDFVDQEHLMLHALDDAGVRVRLGAKLRFLVVDEFQDTSPIQLALFSRIAELADEVLFVGDAKQAIYGFRGSDPHLPLDVIRHVESGGGRLENLTESRRSRAGLVHLVNELFTQPFAHLLTADQVRLTPRVSSPLVGEELVWWKLDESNQEKRALALAGGLRKIVDDGQLVWDKERGQARPVEWRDVAVLCRSKDEAAALAQACARYRVPTAWARFGLLETPEVTLALACLRRLADPGDSLASAEILSLENGVDAESWLGERLDAVDAGAHRDWADDASPMLRRLANARVDIGHLSPEEALSAAIHASDLHRLVVGWDESARLTEHRLANLTRLTELAKEYGEHCRAQSLAGTVSGLILWLRWLEQKFADDQATSSGNAITVLTYHRAKGLEWPIVVCASLDTDLKVSLYGPRVIASANPFDWNAPLAGRALRFWPNPFPEQKGCDPLTDRLSATPAWADAEMLAKNEAIQLLYVGMTRARDQLILTEERRNRVGRWLALLESPLFPIAGGALTLPSGDWVDTCAMTLSAEASPSAQILRPRHWLPEAAAPAPAFLDYYAPPSAVPALAGSTCAVVHDFGTRISLAGKPDMEQLGVALHHALAIALSDPGVGRSVIEDVLAQYPGVILDAEEILARAGALAAWIDVQYPGANLHCELPFSRQLASGQMQIGQIDLALQMGNAWVVIDHKSNPQPKTEWLALAAEHSGQLAAYAEAVSALGGQPVVDRLIHFSVSGGLVRVSS